MKKGLLFSKPFNMFVHIVSSRPTLAEQEMMMNMYIAYHNGDQK